MDGYSYRLPFLKAPIGTSNYRRSTHNVLHDKLTKFHDMCTINSTYCLVGFGMTQTQITDQEIINLHGGVSALARKLNYKIQRVQNWTNRGIPYKEKVSHPELFMNQKSNQQATT